MKRPALERYGPIRSWAAALGSDESSGASVPRQAASGDAVRTDDPIVRGVVVGGRVVDEWIRQAQQTARLLGGTTPARGWPDASARTFKAASDLMAAWWSVWGVAPGTATDGWGWSPPFDQSRVRSSPSASEPVPPHPPVAHTPPGAPVNATRVRLNVRSRKAVEVIVDVHRNGAHHFRVLDLRCQNNDSPRIKGAYLERGETDGLRVSLEVPDDQPHGIYHAVVLDAATDAAVGTLTVTVRD